VTTRDPGPSFGPTPATALALAPDAVADRVVASLYRRAERVARAAVRPVGRERDFTRRLDRVLTSRLTGLPIMALALGAALWLTVVGANYPSRVIAALLFDVEHRLSALLTAAGAPVWLHGVLVLGMYRTLAWVVSVMLPPMAIFFPCFTLLEDLGYLPRVAFNLDALFRRAGACGKQSLTMCMGFGCNAAGVVSCRIIDSPRERLLAVLTNNFVICNGRFPTLIAMAGILTDQWVRGRPAVPGLGVPGPAVPGLAALSDAPASLIAPLIVVGVVLTGIAATFAVCWLLSRTLLRGVPSFFALELPPLRRPRVGQVVVRSILDRTVYVLWRAVAVAAPAGAVVWVLGNTFVGGRSLVAHLAGWLGPVGRLMGLDGFIVAAFILGLPANEIVLPILLMSYLSTGMMIEVESLGDLARVLLAHGWTWLTAVNYMLFSLLHWPCATTLLTIRKETQSRLWTAAAGLLPAGAAFAVCTAVAWAARLAGLV